MTASNRLTSITGLDQGTRCKAGFLLWDRAILSTMRSDDDNGLLARMSAVEIGAALQRLPDAESYSSDEIRQWSTVPSMGGLLLTFKRHRHQHGKNVLTFWVAVKAERGYFSSDSTSSPTSSWS